MWIRLSISLILLALKSILSKDCIDEGTIGLDYDGKVSITSDGHHCQKWREDFQTTESYSIQWFWDMVSLLYDIEIDIDERYKGNYCRNPGNDYMPYCFMHGFIKFNILSFETE